jgi:omega-6 fatty acid desaturase (delta-12 desaturase)
MNERPAVASDTPPGGAWSKTLAPYRVPKTGRSIFEIAFTVLPLLAIWALAWALHAHGWWWAALPLTIPAALFLVRLFMIQHDCGHGSFFGPRQANDWVGRVIGVFTLTPFEQWRITLEFHHASSGFLESGGMGDIGML